MRECSKSIVRRLHNPNYVRKYFAGNGVDIGGKPDPLELYIELFPLCQSLRTWDLDDGDAQKMASVPDNTFDFVFSSHCLEHMVDPKEALVNWIRIVKPGGYLIITVPDEDLYEQGIFPSTFNHDHKWTFTICKGQSWSSRSISLLHFLVQFSDAVEVHRIEQMNFDYRHSLPRYDRTITPVGECAIEMVLRRRTELGTQVVASGSQPKGSLRRHYNQYKADRQAVIANNKRLEPFKDENEI